MSAATREDRLTSCKHRVGAASCNVAASRTRQFTGRRRGGAVQRRGRLHHLRCRFRARDLGAASTGGQVHDRRRRQAGPRPRLDRRRHAPVPHRDGVPSLRPRTEARSLLRSGLRCRPARGRPDRPPSPRSPWCCGSPGQRRVLGRWQRSERQESRWGGQPALAR